MGGKLTQAPATPELVERLRDQRHVMQGDGLAALLATTSEAADALEAQQARIAELEGGAGINPDTGDVITWRDECRRLTESLVAVKRRAAEAQALADRYEKALEFYADPETYHAVTVFCDPPCGAFIDDFSDDHEHPEYVRPMPGKLARQALSSQGRHEGGEPRVDDLAMLVRMLVQHVPETQQIHGRALDYLARHGLTGSPLRTSPDNTNPKAGAPEHG